MGMGVVFPNSEPFDWGLRPKMLQCSWTIWNRELIGNKTIQLNLRERWAKEQPEPDTTVPLSPRFYLFHPTTSPRKKQIPASVQHKGPHATQRPNTLVSTLRMQLYRLQPNPVCLVWETRNWDLMLVWGETQGSCRVGHKNRGQRVRVLVDPQLSRVTSQNHWFAILFQSELMQHKILIFFSRFWKNLDISPNKKELYQKFNKIILKSCSTNSLSVSRTVWINSIQPSSFRAAGIFTSIFLNLPLPW